MLVPAAMLAVGTAEVLGARPDGWGWGLALRGWSPRSCWSAPSLAAPHLHGGGRDAALDALVGPQLDDLATPILFLALLVLLARAMAWSTAGLIGLAVLMALFLLDYLVVDGRPTASATWSS